MAARSSAWTLALVFAVLVVYASLYPFEGWRAQGVDPWAYLWAPFPQYWTAFDLWTNLVGYAPLGFLLAVAMLRSGRRSYAWPLAVVAPALLSLVIESIQTYLPMRVPSNVDLALNTAGGLLGASGAWVLLRLGALSRWSQFRSDWFVDSAHGSLVLLALWPFALLYPATVPFGLGQVAERLEEALHGAFEGTPFLSWLPPAVDVSVPLSPLAEVLCIALGLMAPLLLGYADLRSRARRGVFVFMLAACAVASSGLSAALTYGPLHAWAWLTPQAAVGMGLALLLALACLPLPVRWCQVGLLLSLAISLSLLNRAPATPYFAQSLEVWEQGRFIRFHGLSQWLGWLWPFAALWMAIRPLARPARRAE